VVVEIVNQGYSIVLKNKILNGIFAPLYLGEGQGVREQVIVVSYINRSRILLSRSFHQKVIHFEVRLNTGGTYYQMFLQASDYPPSTADTFWNEPFPQSSLFH
jgi:hypothetical protein